MRTEVLNVLLAMYAVISLAALALIAGCPQALETLGRKMRARSRALLASREAFDTTYAHSIREQGREDQERREMRRLFVEYQERES
jgi:hypothetical protein